MFPLLCRDRLVIPYVAVYCIFILLYKAPGWKQVTRGKSSSSFVKSLLVAVITMISFLLHVIYLTLSPPMKYPFLFEAIIMLLCFSQFITVAVYTNKKQWMLSTLHSAPMAKEKNLWFLIVYINHFSMILTSRIGGSKYLPLNMLQKMFLHIWTEWVLSNLPRQMLIVVFNGLVLSTFLSSRNFIH